MNKEQTENEHPTFGQAFTDPAAWACILHKRSFTPFDMESIDLVNDGVEWAVRVVPCFKDGSSMKYYITVPLSSRDVAMVVANYFAPPIGIDCAFADEAMEVMETVVDATDKERRRRGIEQWAVDTESVI